MVNNNGDIRRRSSYTAASSYPIKVPMDEDLVRSIYEEGRIIPIHLQLSPTNKCNLDCPWCSCSERDKKVELSYERIKRLFDIGEKLGSKAVTITGGGEPALHPNISDMIRYAHSKGISPGLVSNGLLFSKVDTDALRRLVWSRVSFGDNREFGDKFEQSMEDAIRRAPNVDWAFSYVLGNGSDEYKPNYDNLMKIVLFANAHGFTHVRFVPDLYHPDVVNMEDVKEKLREEKVDDHLVIYQGRKEWTKGTPYCYISLLKPIIDARGGIYPCCGVQYAEKNPSRDFTLSMRMGDIEDLPKIYETQSQFDGSNCVKCYYQQYNDILAILLGGIKHREFV